MAKPNHIAFILDGNRRWAKKRFLPALLGHRKGVEAIKKTLLALIDEQIKYASFYCFSTENWKRSKEEVNGLMEIFQEYFEKGLKFFLDTDIKVEIFGDITAFPQSVQNSIIQVKNKTKNCKTLNAGFCLNYGGREDILKAVNSLIANGKKILTAKDLSQKLFTASFPDPDFIIRTSGEMRLSNFMLWQASYSELYFPKTLWPDFNKNHLKKALEEFSNRTRRFGGD